MDLNKIEQTSITIDKDGIWYYEQAEMFRKDIVHILAVNIHRTEFGDYYIQMGKERRALHVEDAPFYAAGYEEQTDGSIKLIFHDLQEYVLGKKTKLHFKDGVPYISYKWENDTKLSRSVYWKLSDFFDVRGDDVFIVIPGV